MRIMKLNLESFRRYDKLELPLSEGSQVFLGDNGSGKTNIIEAISLLSQARSCLRADLSTLIRFGEDFLKVRAEVTSDAGESSSLEFVFQMSPRKSSAFFRNDVNVPLLSFIGVLPTITFLPQALSLFSGPPADRRGYLDALMTQLRPAYATERMEYERILKQRNALLKSVAAGEAKEADLDLWDERIATVGSHIVTERRSVLGEMNKELLPCMISLSETYESVVGEYRSSFEGEGASALKDALLHVRSRDIMLQSTTVGPHRDDWRCLADDHDMAHFASRGQQRTAFLALLFVSAGLFESARHERPVILLDDVLSELDDTHQAALLTHFKDHQVLITGTHPTDDLADLVTWQVQGGKVAAM